MTRSFRAFRRGHYWRAARARRLVVIKKREKQKKERKKKTKKKKGRKRKTFNPNLSNSAEISEVLLRDFPACKL